MLYSIYLTPYETWKIKTTATNQTSANVIKGMTEMGAANRFDPRKQGLIVFRGGGELNGFISGPLLQGTVD